MPRQPSCCCGPGGGNWCPICGRGTSPVQWQIVITGVTQATGLGCCTVFNGTWFADLANCAGDDTQVVSGGPEDHTCCWCADNGAGLGLCLSFGIIGGIAYIGVQSVGGGCGTCVTWRRPIGAYPGHINWFNCELTNDSLPWAGGFFCATPFVSCGFGSCVVTAIYP